MAVPNAVCQKVESIPLFVCEWLFLSLGRIPRPFASHGRRAQVMRPVGRRRTTGDVRLGLESYLVLASYRLGPKWLDPDLIFRTHLALAKFKEAKIEDPATCFKGKTVRVTGEVVLYQGKPQIAV